MSGIKKPIGFKEGHSVFNEKITSWVNEDNEIRQPVYGVFNGGGPKGAAFAGSIKVVEKEVRWQGVSGTSAGAITAALIAAGYDGNSIVNISKSLDFNSLLDRFDLNEVREAAQQWTSGPDVDWLTWLLLQTAPALLKPDNQSALERRLRDKLLSHETGMKSKDITKDVDDFIFNAGSTAYSAMKSTSTFLRSLVGWEPREFALSDKVALVSALTLGSDEAKQAALLELLEMVFGSHLPPAMVDTLMSEDEHGRKVDPDKAFSVLLGLYYKGGAYKGDTIRCHIEDFLQQALRREADYDLSKPVTFKELLIPLKVIAADLSNQRLLSFPEDLLNYGYDDQDENSPNYYKNFSVAEAVRASMSIPLLFEPVYLADLSASKDKENPEAFVTLVDGGLMNNFPVSQFSQDNQDLPIFGFWLGPNPDLVPSVSTDRVSGYLTGLIGALMSAHDKDAMDKARDQLLLVEIPLDIDLTSTEIEALKQQTLAEQTRCQSQLGDINKALDQFTANKSIISDDAELVKFIEQKEAGFSRVKADLDDQLSELAIILGKIADKSHMTRKTETLDFSLTDDQKEQLIMNGEEAARKALKGSFNPSP
ncbi:MAG: hypothetical protein COA42_01890 [Alteromonadaceae bacterium]|nr:MAG: hypothetical protein COA42_01890 [Alteromonadaceae bacterium]